jgi:hypothetical protein
VAWIQKLLTFSKNLEVRTAIGLVRATASFGAALLSSDSVTFRAINFEPPLPPGMSVQKCTLLLLVVEGLVDIEALSLNLTLESKAIASPCLGECLDAQEWSENGKLVVIGTEDGAALSHRFPGIGLEDKVVVELSDHSMTLQLYKLGQRKNPSFHFIIAENEDPEPVEPSAWFAVDQAHEFLLSKR